MSQAYELLVTIFSNVPGRRNFEKKVRIWTTLKPGQNLGGAKTSFIGVISAKKIMVVKRAPNNVVTVDSCIAKNGSPIIDMFVADLNERADGSSSAKNTLSKDFAETENENGFKKTDAHCVPDEKDLQKGREIVCRGGVRLHQGKGAKRENQVRKEVTSRGGLMARETVD